MYLLSRTSGGAWPNEKYARLSELRENQKSCAEGQQLITCPYIQCDIFNILHHAKARNNNL